MRERALPNMPDPDTPIARGTSVEDASTQILREWIMSEEEMKQEKDAEGGGLRNTKKKIDKRKKYFTKLATSAAARQPGMGKWDKTERQTEQGARTMEMLSEDDDAESDQGHTSSVPESGASLVGQGRPVPTKTRTPTAVKNKFQHLDSSELNDTSADEGGGAETESCQEDGDGQKRRDA